MTPRLITVEPGKDYFVDGPCRIRWLSHRPHAICLEVTSEHPVESGVQNHGMLVAAIRDAGGRQQ